MTTAKTKEMKEVARLEESLEQATENSRKAERKKQEILAELTVASRKLKPPLDEKTGMKTLLTTDFLRKRDKIFMSVYDLKSFTRTAERLHMTQPAVTFQVRQFEEEFNTLVFDRAHNRVTQTENGTHLYNALRVRQLATIENSSTVALGIMEIERLSGIKLFTSGGSALSLEAIQYFTAMSDLKKIIR